MKTNDECHFSLARPYALYFVGITNWTSVGWPPLSISMYAIHYLITPALSIIHRTEHYIRNHEGEPIHTTKEEHNKLQRETNRSEYVLYLFISQWQE